MIDDDAATSWPTDGGADGRAGRQGGGCHRGRAGDRARGGAGLRPGRGRGGGRRPGRGGGGGGPGTRRGGRGPARERGGGDFEDAGRLVAAAVETFGGLDGVVSNAGVVRDRMIFNMAPDEFDLVLRVNLRGTFNMARHAP